MPRKAWLALLLILVLACAFTLCATSACGLLWWLFQGNLLGLPVPTVAPGEATLRLWGAEPVTLDPALVEDAASAEYIQKIFCGLVGLNENLEVVPELAERWEISEDGRIYTFYIRRNARFHNGKPVTAWDFKYSLERALDPETGSHVAGLYLGDIVGAREKLAGQAEEVRGIEVIDDYTLRLTIDAPKAYFLAKLTYPTAFVVDRENVKGGGTTWTEHPNGTGPFKLKEKNEQHIVLVAFEDYWAGACAIKRVEFILRGGSPMTMYEQGELDVVSVSAADIERVLDPTNPLHDELVVTPLLYTHFIGFNVRRPPFDDVKVRQAFAYATNKRAIVDVFYKKMRVLAKGILPPGMPGYNEELEGIPFDPVRARELLRESRYGAPEELPPITLTVSGVGGTSPFAELMAQMYEENLGVSIAIEQVEWKDFLKGLNRHEYQMFALAWNADYPDPQNFLDIQFHSQSEGNNCLYANPRVDELLEKARVEKDFDERMRLYQEVEKIIVEEAPWIPLSHGVDYTLVKPYVKGLVINPQGMYCLKNAYITGRD